MKNLKFISINRVSVTQLLTILFIAVVYSMITTSIAYGQVSDTELPKGKQTNPGLYVTAKEAYAKWMASPEKVKIIDVRTPEEYIFVGHAEMAWNIPFAYQSCEWDEEKKHFPMKPHPDFVSRVQELFAPEDTLLVTCRSGGRSAMSVNLLAAAGFKYVYNITDGVEGDKVKDPASVYHGQRLRNGWKNSGLPWTFHADPKQMRLPKE